MLYYDVKRKIMPSSPNDYYRENMQQLINYQWDNTTMLQTIEEETPLNKIGKPLDIYRCVKWIIEDEFKTGQIISPNGGYVI